MALKRTSYTDEVGRKFAVLLPDEEPEENAVNGIPLGPPDLSELGLPLELEIRLNHELFARDIFLGKDILKRRQDIQSAIQSVLRLDTERVVTLYIGKDYKNARQESPEVKSNPPVPNRRPRRTR